MLSIEKSTLRDSPNLFNLPIKTISLPFLPYCQMNSTQDQLHYVKLYSCYLVCIFSRSHLLSCYLKILFLMCSFVSDLLIKNFRILVNWWHSKTTFLFFLDKKKNTQSDRVKKNSELAFSLN